MIITEPARLVVDTEQELVDGNTGIVDGLLTPEDKRRLRIGAIFEIRSGVRRTYRQSRAALVGGGVHGRSRGDAAIQHRRCLHGSTVQETPPHRLQLPRILVYPCRIPLIRDEIARRITRTSRFAQIHLNYAVGDVRSPVSVRGRDWGDASVTQDKKEDRCAHP
jgi:hypothetical protein